MTTSTVLTTQEIATQLVEKCRQDQSEWVHQHLYNPDIISIEENSPDPKNRESRGLAACEEKGKMWKNTMEVHSANISDPLVSNNEFSVLFHYNVTHKESGKRFDMKEIAVYEVRDGKIWKENFFYCM